MQSYPSPLWGALDRISTALESEVAKTDSREETERAERDLKAQEEMAHWAYWMFVAAVASVIVTAIGVGLVYATAIYARRAAEAAKDTVNEMKIANKAAMRAAMATENAVAVQVDAIQRLERPYLFIEIGHNGALRRPGPETIPFMHCNLVNHGKLPAILRALSIVLMPYDRIRFENRQPILEPYNNFPIYEVIAPGGRVIGEEKGKVRAVVFTAERGESWENKTETLALCAILHYEDPTGALHRDKLFFLRVGLETHTDRARRRVRSMTEAA